MWHAIFTWWYECGNHQCVRFSNKKIKRDELSPILLINCCGEYLRVKWSLIGWKQKKLCLDLTHYRNNFFQKCYRKCRFFFTSGHITNSFKIRYHLEFVYGLLIICTRWIVRSSTYLSKSAAHILWFLNTTFWKIMYDCCFFILLY